MRTQDSFRMTSLIRLWHVVLSFWRQPRSNMAGHHGDCPLAMNGILPTWSSSSALYIILCSRTPRLYCLPSTTLPTDPSAIIPNYIATSRKPASPNLLPITANKLQMVCKTLNRYKAWSKTHSTSSICRVFVMYCAWHSTSYTVDILVAGSWTVGR